MEMEIKVKGDMHEDAEQLRVFSHAQELYHCVFETRQKIRSRMKHEEISEPEYDFLVQLSDMLFIDPIELG